MVEEMVENKVKERGKTIEEIKRRGRCKKNLRDRDRTREKANEG